MEEDGAGLRPVMVRITHTTVTVVTPGLIQITVDFEVIETIEFQPLSRTMHIFNIDLRQTPLVVEMLDTINLMAEYFEDL